MAVFVPRPYQHLIRNFIFEHERCNVFAGMGLGKTSSSIRSFDELRTFGEVNRALVLAPKRVAESSWPDEMVKWRESFGHLRMAAAVGTAAERLAAVRSQPDILTSNYENIEWLLGVYGDEWPFDMVFADESTRLKRLRVSLQKSGRGKEFITGQGSSRAKALAKIAHTKVRRWVNLTGSPAPNGLIDVWGQQWFVDAGRRPARWRRRRRGIPFWGPHVSPRLFRAWRIVRLGSGLRWPWSSSSDGGCVAVWTSVRAAAS